MVEIIKCGSKCGRKLSNSEDSWVEKWYEIKCKDI
jgi:hypothetical protein